MKKQENAGGKEAEKAQKEAPQAAMMPEARPDGGRGYAKEGSSLRDAVKHLGKCER